MDSKPKKNKSVLFIIPYIEDIYIQIKTGDIKLYMSLIKTI